MNEIDNQVETNESEFLEGLGVTEVKEEEVEDSQQPTFH